MVSRKGIPVWVFSIEMDGDRLVSRMLFGRAGVDTAEFMQGFAEKQEDFQARLAKAAAELAKSKIYIDASPAQTMGQIAAKARRNRSCRRCRCIGGGKLTYADYTQSRHTPVCRPGTGT